MMSNKKQNKKSSKAIERMERTKFGMYAGPIRVGESKYSDKLDVVNLTSQTTTSSNGVGVIAAELTFNPNTTTEWASFAARYREYRVLAVEIEWMPYHVANTTAITVGPLYIGLNKAGTLGTPTSKSQVFALAASDVKHTARKWRFVIRPDDYTDLDVGSTALPSSEFSFLLYGNGFSISATYGDIAMRWVVQFSARQ